jgi:dihydroneopterin aldolase
MFDAFIKVGGSVCYGPELKALAPQWAALARQYRLLFMAGGGLFADQVRMIDEAFDLSDSAAHWMAIAAMDQCGYLLADCLPGVEAVHDLDKALSMFASGSSAVLIPSSLLRQYNPLPHRWEVTSDSLAAWLTGFAGIKPLILLKDVPGVYQTDSSITPSPLLEEVTRDQLSRYEVVDAYFPKALPNHIECWILDGRQPDRLATLLETGKTAGTRILQNRATS